MTEIEPAPPQVKKRIDWPDALKGLGMLTFFVGHLGGHFGLLGSEMGMKIFKFNAGSFVSAFFMLSGYLWKDRGMSFPVYLKSRAKARLVPVFVFWVIGLALTLLTLAVTSNLNKVWMMRVLGWIADLPKGWAHFNPVAWALVCLFVIEVLQFFLAKITKPTAAVLALCALCITLTWAFPFNVNVYQQPKHLQGWWFITPAIALMPFFQLGLLFRRWRLPDRIPYWGHVTIALLAFVTLLLTFDLNNGPWIQEPRLPMVLFAFSQFGQLYWFFPNALLGALLLFSSCHIFERVGVLTELGRHTAAFVCLNSYFLLIIDLHLVRFLYQKLGITSPVEVIVAMGVVTVVSIAICMPIVKLIDRRAPWMAGRDTPLEPRPPRKAEPVLQGA